MSISNELVQEAKNGNRKATDEVIDSMIGFIHMTSNKFWGNNKNINREEYVQQGYLATWEAIRKFEISRGVKFSSYAGKCIILQMRLVAKPHPPRLKDIGFPKVSIDHLDTKNCPMKKIRNREGYYTREEIDGKLEQIEKIIPSLEEKQREVFVKHYFNFDKPMRLITLGKHLKVPARLAGELGRSAIQKIRRALADLN